MKKKVLAIFMAALTATAMVGTVAVQAEEADAQTEDTTETEKNADDEEESEGADVDVATGTDENTITICTTNDPGKEAAWTALANAYMEKHPDIKVVVDLKASENYDQWVQTAFTSEEPTADIVNINLAGDAKKGKSINYMEYIDNDSPYSDGTWGEQFDVSKQTINMADNSFDALSLDTVQVIWLYNADIFKEVGVEAPTTWDELIDVCGKIQAISQLL